MGSILTQTKKLLGIEQNYTQFDTDIIIHINSALSILTQLGVGPSTGFSITDKTATWSQFVGEQTKLEAVRTYVYLKVKLIFDPPSAAAAIESINSVLKQLEWRISITTDKSQN